MRVVPGGIPRYGVRLGDVPFGSIVMLPLNGMFYHVICLMDGTGHRAMVVAGSGTLKHFGQETRVIPVEATLYVGGPDESFGDRRAHRPAHLSGDSQKHVPG